MNASLFNLLVAIGTTLAVLAVGIVATGLDPSQAGFAGHAIMQISIFVASAGVFFLVINQVKKRLFTNQLPYERARSSWRHAFLAALLLSGWLFLKTSHVLRWWNLILFILALTVLEFFFMTSPSESSYERSTETPEN